MGKYDTKEIVEYTSAMTHAKKVPVIFFQYWKNNSLNLDQLNLLYLDVSYLKGKHFLESHQN